MPKLPRWMNNAVEGLLHSKFREVTATSIIAITPKMRKITFTGDFTGLKCLAGYAIAIKISETEYRNYTPFNFDNRSFDIYFYLHDMGPGSKFIKEVIPGQQLKILIPRGKEMYRNESLYHFFIGDETSLGFCQSLTIEAEINNKVCNGIIEIEDTTIVETIALSAFEVETINPQKLLLIENYIKDYMRILYENETITFYLTGNAATIQVVRKMLKSMDIPRKNIITQAYWAQGKCGL